jgi:pimeloyl-ACP methyl ester carboxylesterase/outer membrane protein assembly factor BamB
MKPVIRVSLLALMLLPSLVRSQTAGHDADAVGLDRKVMAEVKAASEVKANLSHLCDEIGSRLTGSKNLKRASDWVAAKMTAYGLSNVHHEPWSLPEGWERGPATVRIIEPDTGMRLSVASWAWAPGTNGKVQGEVVFVNATTSQELAAYKGKLKGAIVLAGSPYELLPPEELDKPGPWMGAFKRDKLFQRPFPEILAFLKERAEFVRREGAIALFMDAGKPHGLLFTTGTWEGKDRPSATNRLPSLFVAHNHYALLHRLATRPAPARTRVEIDVQNTFVPGPIAVNNTVGEIRGSDRPDEVVVVGAHLDSWDLGQGATDNGTGSVVVLEAARALIKSGVRPRRTIRFILFTGEEQGLLGSKAYVQAHKDELPRISACLVHDSGTGKVVGFCAGHRPVLQPILAKELASLKELGVSGFDAPFAAGSDHASFEQAGVPGLFFRQEVAGYRLSHHSQADTLDRAIEANLVQGAEVMAVTALRIANRDALLPREKPATNVALANGEFTATLNGLKLWYRVSGRGPVCLMPNPAWGPGCEYYLSAMKPLERYFTMVYLESRGTGRSERAKSSKEYTWDHLVADLEALRVHLKQDKVWLMGHSEGGMQVLHCAVKHPNSVNGLVLLNTSPALDESWAADYKARALRHKDQPWFKEAMAALARNVRGSAATEKEFRNILAISMPLYWSDPAKIAEHKALFDGTSVSVEASRGQQDSGRIGFNLTKQLKSITAPALIVSGDDDFICSPAQAKRMHLNLPNSKLLVIEKCGHFPWLEQPRAFFEDVPAFLEAFGLQVQPLPAANVAQRAALAEGLLAAARKGDTATVKSLLAQGADVNAKSAYGAAALSFAAEKGHLEVVKVLLQYKADVNIRDKFYKISALEWALSRPHVEIVKALLAAGAQGADSALQSGAAQGRVDLVRAVLDAVKLKEDALSKALAATPEKATEVRALLTKAGARAPAPSKEVTVDRELLSAYAGTYFSDRAGELKILLEGDKLSARFGAAAAIKMRAIDKVSFKTEVGAVQITFRQEGGKVTGLSLKAGSTDLPFKRGEPSKEPVAKATPEDRGGVVKTPLNWPSFRGPNASGVADGQYPPLTWDAEKGSNILWKTPIPGLGHSCPIVWEDRVYITTAVSRDGKSSLKPGQYGNVDSVKETSEHEWKLYCLDKRSGKVLWERTACKGVPKIKRHTKGTHANPTPATDGTHVVASFGSEGLYCFHRDGKLLWQKSLGVLDSGWFYDADYQWGFGSSPVLYRGLVIVQCDVGKNSFLAAYRVEDGKEVWRKSREEIPSWGTPTIVEGPGRVELVTNASNYARGYDPLTGTELWRLSRHSEITVPTPIYGAGLIFITSGYRPVQPIYAIRPGATGDISLKDGKTANDAIAWSTSTGGTYMPTPIVYGEYLYTCANAGILTCYEAKTGKEVYKKRLGGQGGYTASPVAADGKLYFTSEQGGVRVVRAGPKYELLAVNPLGDVCLATPAISDGMIFVRTEHYLMGIGRKAAGKQ